MHSLARPLVHSRPAPPRPAPTRPLPRSPQLVPIYRAMAAYADRAAQGDAPTVDDPDQLQPSWDDAGKPPTFVA